VPFIRKPSSSLAPWPSSSLGAKAPLQGPLVVRPSYFAHRRSWAECPWRLAPWGPLVVRRAPNFCGGLLRREGGGGRGRRTLVRFATVQCTTGSPTLGVPHWESQCPWSPRPGETATAYSPQPCLPPAHKQRRGAKGDAVFSVRFRRCKVPATSTCGYCSELPQSSTRTCEKAGSECQGPPNSPPFEATVTPERGYSGHSPEHRGPRGAPVLVPPRLRVPVWDPDSGRNVRSDRTPPWGAGGSWLCGSL